ncbi:hypothetical protein TNCV_301291 [Trichonephila clavipes]|nr:hypothetical protein TNCV_301291 [Trichonephila clavipes]
MPIAYGAVVCNGHITRWLYQECYPDGRISHHTTFASVDIRCDEAHFWLNGYVNKQNCRIWSEANPQVYVETPLHPKKLTVWCALKSALVESLVRTSSKTMKATTLQSIMIGIEP